jgi:biopolymer transport protein ExbD
LEYFVERIIIPEENLEQDLRELIGDQKDVVVVLHVDKNVPVQYLMNVAGIAAKYKAKVSIAAEKSSQP